MSNRPQAFAGKLPNGDVDRPSHALPQPQQLASPSPAMSLLPSGPELAGAVTAASATIGPILPPSLPTIIYGVTAEASIGALFIGAVIPGLAMAAALMLTARAIAARHNLPAHPLPSLGEVGLAFKEAFWALMTPVLLLGGIISGIFTPTEAAVVAAAYALLIGAFVYRDFRLSDLPTVIVSTVQTTGVVTGEPDSRADHVAAGPTRAGPLDFA